MWPQNLTNIYLHACSARSFLFDFLFESLSSQITGFAYEFSFISSCYKGVFANLLV